MYAIIAGLGRFDSAMWYSLLLFTVLSLNKELRHLRAALQKASASIAMVFVLLVIIIYTFASAGFYMLEKGGFTTSAALTDWMMKLFICTVSN